MPEPRPTYHGSSLKADAFAWTLVGVTAVILVTVLVCFFNLPDYLR